MSNAAPNGSSLLHQLSAALFLTRSNNPPACSAEILHASDRAHHAYANWTRIHETWTSRMEAALYKLSCIIWSEKIDLGGQLL